MDSDYAFDMVLVILNNHHTIFNYNKHYKDLLKKEVGLSLLF